MFWIFLKERNKDYVLASQSKHGPVEGIERTERLLKVVPLSLNWLRMENSGRDAEK